MQFSLIEMWHAMTFLPKAVAILLMILSVITIYMFIERQITFRKARNKSMQVAPKLAELLKNGAYKDAYTLASKKEYKGSHLARVTAGSIQAFMEGRDAKLDVDEQIASAARGSERAQSIYDQELRRGLSTLATIATSSPFIGLFGTVFGIINAFRGMALTGSGGIGAIAVGIAEALVATGLGIGVAIVALWVFNALSTRCEIFGAEMSNTSSQVIDFFVRTVHSGDAK